MRRMSILMWVALFLLACVSCGGDEGKIRDLDLARLAAYLTGSFSSQEQAAADPSYRDIRLEMARIWRARTDGVWLYVEQAAAGSLDRPYRQGVYRVSRMNDYIFVINVFTLENPLRFAGEWKKEHPFAMLTPDSLSEREGCFFHLRKYGGAAFMGSTIGKGCTSILGGASYVTSEVTITEFDVTSWSRGFNDKEKQVWGASKGGYVFKKVEDYDCQ